MPASRKEAAGEGGEGGKYELAFLPFGERGAAGKRVVVLSADGAENRAAAFAKKGNLHSDGRAKYWEQGGAAVEELGGAMSHAAIIAREYGLPAVVGTGHATKRIVTGQRVRVDGTSGIVTILD